MAACPCAFTAHMPVQLSACGVGTPCGQRALMKDLLMTPRSTRPLGWTALSLVLALAACGGGSGSGSDPAPTPTPRDRIEPYDPGAAKQGAAGAGFRTASAVRTAASVARTVALGPLSGAALKAASSATPGTALQIGQARSVEATASVAGTAALLDWQPTARGSRVAALRFVAEGARGVRLGVYVEALPAEALLRVYSTQGEAVEVSAQALAALALRNAEGGASDMAARTYWSPDFGTSEATLEVEIPAQADPAGVRIAVPGLSHFTRSPAEAEAPVQDSGAARRKAGESGSCNQDASCSPEYLEQSRSVARMVYVKDGNSFLCTGTLMNDTASTGTPFFLSAHHCISSQVVASTLTTDWFYRSSSCGAAQTNPATKRLTGGATLLHAAIATDVALLRLHDAAPAGAVYAGSYFGGAPALGDTLAGLHHPSGDLQKFSTGTLQRYSQCNPASMECNAATAADAGFLTLAWQKGITEGGSSGSAAFLALQGKRYVVGQLLGGASSCADPSGVDHYGRFDVAYRSALSKWLAP